MKLRVLQNIHCNRYYQDQSIIFISKLWFDIFDGCNCHFDQVSLGAPQPTTSQIPDLLYLEKYWWPWTLIAQYCTLFH